MKKADEILLKLLGNLKVTENRSYTSLFGSWEKIAGIDIANHSELIDIKNKILFINVDHPGWIQLIQIKKKEIKRRIKSVFPELEIQDIRIFLGKQKPAQNKRIKHAEKALPDAENSDTEGSRKFKKLLEKLKNRVE